MIFPLCLLVCSACAEGSEHSVIYSFSKQLLGAYLCQILEICSVRLLKEQDRNSTAAYYQPLIHRWSSFHTRKVKIYLFSPTPHCFKQACGFGYTFLTCLNFSLYFIFFPSWFCCCCCVLKNYQGRKYLKSSSTDCFGVLGQSFNPSVVKR